MRGEEVLEFNLSPYYFKELKNGYFTYNNIQILVYSTGWNKIKDYYYLEIQTPEGIVMCHSLTYKIK